MAWEGSDRRSRLPKDWARKRRSILVRDKYLCQIINPDTNGICGEAATEVDHIIAGDDHSPTNLQAICHWHHVRKSSAEGAAARIKFAPRNRPKERHPGLK